MRILRDDQDLVIEDGEVGYYLKLVGIGPNTLKSNSKEQLPAIIAGVNGFYLFFKQGEDIQSELNKIVGMSVTNFNGG